MKAVVMAVGFGTRIQPLTNSIPKPMLPVINRPMMEHVMLRLKEHTEKFHFDREKQFEFPNSHMKKLRCLFRHTMQSSSDTGGLKDWNFFITSSGP